VDSQNPTGALGGPTKHATIISIWHMLTAGQPYQNLGADYCIRRDPEATKRRIIRQANDMGLTARFEPIEQLG
jgi:transposase